MTPTPAPELDRAVQTLADNRRRWAALPVRARLDLLRACAAATFGTAADSVRAGCEAKGLDFDSPASAEEWLGGPVAVLRNLRLLAASLRDIDTLGRPRLRPDAIRRRPDGQVVVDVFPASLADRLLFAGFREEVWMEPGVTAESLADTMAVAYRPDADREGGVALVLGAGNVASIGPMDVLYKLFVENRVAILKMNPVNDYLGPFVERALAPLVAEGVLRIAYGGAGEGGHLAHHALVDEVHLTGSDTVHDAIVWGASPDEQTRNRRNGTPVLRKRITSELGCVTPVIVVPGRWSPRELAFQAENVATMVALNASCNCNAAKTILTWRGWPQRQAFVDAVAAALAALPSRKAYYPGSAARFDLFLGAHPEAVKLGAAGPDTLPWTTIFGVDPAATGDPVFTREAWCPIIAESPLEAQDAVDFLDQAVRFSNDHLWGTLSGVVIAHPQTVARLGDRFERALADLRYGTIGVNHWAALSFVLAVAPWGAYPGHTLDAIGSGIGVVHNTRMFARPQKSVLRGPFVTTPKAPWFVGHRASHRVARRLAGFEARPSLWRIPGIAAAAVTG